MAVKDLSSVKIMHNSIWDYNIYIIYLWNILFLLTRQKIPAFELVSVIFKYIHTNPSYIIKRATY